MFKFGRRTPPLGGCKDSPCSTSPEELILDGLTEVLLRSIPEGPEREGVRIIKAGTVIHKAVDKIEAQYAELPIRVTPAQQAAALQALSSALAVLTDFLSANAGQTND